jgi:DNA-binding transcriptional MerR regulator
MEKMTEPFLSINDVSKKLGLPAHTLRYWEKQFPVAVKPAKGAGGRRYYRAETVGALTQIKHLLHDKGMTIAGVKKMIKDGGLTAVITPPKIAIVDKSSGHLSRPIKGQENAVGRALELLKLAKRELS